ncbi:MAG: repeat-containing protein, partial [Akkermansiaceae bacterium]|nr:repeat-containing protein [Akkermansiaceae bacterium]
MQKLLRSSLFVVLSALLVLAGTGCSPEAKKARNLAKADKYFAAGKYDEAEIEYKNVLQLEPLNPAALGRLGIIYFNQSRIVFARSYLQKASELSPDNLELRLKLGLSDVAFGDLKSARTRALFILDRAPTNEEAPLLLAEAASNPQELEAARQRLKQLPPAVIDSAPVQVAFGAIELRLNNVDAALAALQRALVLNPKSAEAHAALAVVRVLRKELPLAAQEFKLASELSPARSPKRIQYAQSLIQGGDPAAGRKFLTQMTQETPDYLPAWMMLAELASADRKYDEALDLTSRVLARDTTYPEALLLNARLRMAKGDFGKAVTELERTLRIFPTSPQFLYQIGIAYIASGNLQKATDSLNQALAQAPGYTDARVLLASVSLRTGDSSTAISALKTVIQQHPELIQPRLMLADAYRSRNSADDALAVYDGIEKNFPGNPRTPQLSARVLAQQGKLAEARQALTQALERAPDFQPAVEQMVSLDLFEKKFPAARRRIEDLIAKQPKSAELQILLARVFYAQKDMDQAEATLQKAITLQPDSPVAYYTLAGLYAATNQQQKALDNLQKVITTNPKDTKALMMTGMLNEQLKHYDTALAAYEKLLAINPKAGIALNNAAVLYAERFNQLDKAFEAAQKARELFPHEAHMADTLGWILVKRRQYPWALSLLQESAEKLPDSADTQYHLGMVNYLMGAEEPARVALEDALKLNQEFPGSAEARKCLAVLAIAVDQPGSDARKALEAAIAERPDDPVALDRLAAIQERNGDLGKAVDTYQAALKASPTNTPAMLGLVRVYSLQKDPAKALEQAKAARKLAPESTAVALALGRLSYQTQDYSYAFTLLQEVARKQPEDPAVLRDLARSAYSLGRVADAETALRQSLRLDSLSPAAAEARSFLELMALADHPAQAATETARIAELLKSDAGNVPALMASAAASEQKGDASAAMATYDKVLQQFPDFTPAKKRLVILYAATGSDNKKAFELALKARADLPSDAELAKAFGIILYRQGDFPRALTVLKEGVAGRGADAE